MPRGRGTSQHAECTLCLETLKSPRMLPCVHSFCLECLDNLIHNLARRNTFECPNCRKSIPIPPEGARGFPPNIYVEGCDENVPSEDSDDCDVFTSSSSLQEYDKCNTHTRKFLKFYCRPCEKPICRDCKLTSHEGHQTCDLTHKISRVRTLVDDVKRASEEVVIQAMLKAIDEAKTARSCKLADDRRKIKNEIKQKGETLKHLIDECVRDKLNSCDHLYQTSKETLSKAAAEMHSMMDELLTLMDSINITAREGSQTDVLSLEKRLQDYFFDNAGSRTLSADLKTTLSLAPFSLPKLRAFDTASSITPRLELTSAEHPLSPTDRRRQASSEATVLSAIEAAVKEYIGHVRSVSEPESSQTSVKSRVHSATGDAIHNEVDLRPHLQHGQRDGYGQNRRSGGGVAGGGDYGRGVGGGGGGVGAGGRRQGRITSAAAFDRVPSYSGDDVPSYGVMPHE